MQTDVSLSGQAFVFFAMVLCGFVCGFAFDFFRAFRRIHKSGSGVVALQDIVLWLIELSFVYFAAFSLNYARLRAYEALALVIGSFIYFMLLSQYVLKALCAVIAFVKRAAERLIAPADRLLRKAGRICRKKSARIVQGIRMRFSKLKNMRKSTEPKRDRTSAPFGRLVKKLSDIKILKNIFTI